MEAEHIGSQPQVITGVRYSIQAWWTVLLDSTPDVPSQGKDDQISNSLIVSVKREIYGHQIFRGEIEPVNMR